MKKVTIALCFTLFFLQMGLFAQEAPSIIPPNPEAASIAKFTETPVSYFTGIPDINVPIYEINVSGMSIPINLSYHARGIKVDEIASSVGLGWSFNYGGMISRQTRGLADDANEELIDYSTIFTSPSERISADNNYNLGDIETDFIPDLFFYDANGNSGKFILDQVSNTIALQKFDDIKIQKIMVNFSNHEVIGGFIVTDKYGNKYYYGISKDGIRTAACYEDGTSYTYYGQTGGTVVNPDGDSGRSYNSWMLMDIETAAGVVINYIYEPFLTKYYRRSSDKKVENGFFNVSYSYVWSNEYRLKEISFPEGKVQIDYVNSRQDLFGAKQLDAIRVVDNQNIEKVKYNFDYDYTTSNDTSNQLWLLAQSEPQAFKRLFLNSISRDNELEEYKYQFFYDNSFVLPSRFSNSQDAWGYYNGKPNGSFLEVLSDNRSVNPNLCGIGLLNKIVYPTGGYSEYIYEDNLAIPDNNVSNLTIAKINPITNGGGDVGLGVLDAPQYYNPITNIYTKPIDFGENIVGSVTCNISFTDDTSCSEDVYVPGCKFQVSKEYDGEVVQLFMGTHQLYIEGGVHIFRVMPKTPHNPLSQTDGFNITFSWEKQDVNQNSLIYAGGKRIAEIKLYEYDNQLSIHKQYSYTDNVTGNSTGILFGLPNFYSHWGNIGGFTILDYYGCVPGSPLSNYQGNSVGYYKVTEYTKNNNEDNGKTEYEFTVTKDTGEGSIFPFTMPIDNEWLRGKLLNTKTYKKEIGESYKLVKETQNKYLYAGQHLNYNFIFDGLFTPSNVINSLNDNLAPNYQYFKDEKLIRYPLIMFLKDGQYKVFYFTGGAMDLDYTTEIEYLDNGQRIIHTSTNEYDYVNHYQISKSIFSNSYNITNNELEDEIYSDNEPIETKYYYANSPMLNGLSGISELKIKHMIGIPLKVQSYKAGEKVSEVYTEYFTRGQKCLPHYVYTAKGDLPLERKLTYDVYDNDGNLLQYTMENGNPVYFVWGYNNSKPIIKIEGVTNGVFPSFTNAINFSNTGTEAALIDELKYIRTQLPNAMVTTLTYKPLIGVSSVTDPKGDTQYYTYDAYNRLKFVKDKTGKILSKNEYHYRPTE